MFGYLTQSEEYQVRLFNSIRRISGSFIENNVYRLIILLNPENIVFIH